MFACESLLQFIVNSSVLNVSQELVQAFPREGIAGVAIVVDPAVEHSTATRAVVRTSLPVAIQFSHALPQQLSDVAPVFANGFDDLQSLLLVPH